MTTPKNVAELLQFTPAYAGGGPNEPQKFNPPAGLHLPFDHPDNHWGQFVRGIVTSRRPASASNALPLRADAPSRVNRISE